MDYVFRRGNTVDIFVTFLTLENKEPTTVTEPKTSIRYIDSAYNLVTVVNEAPMVLLGETTYYFRWSIPSSAYLGAYHCEFESVVDGEYSESSTSILIKP